jgi:SAM-dependent methyltransferase
LHQSLYLAFFQLQSELEAKTLEAENLTSVTREMHRLFSDPLFELERARNLWNSCSDYINCTIGSLYLDIGTGLGYNTSIFGAFTKETMGLDIKIPENNILKKTIGSNLIVGDGMNLPFTDQIADLILLFSVIEHVENSEILMNEVSRVLKPKGMLLIQIPNRYFLVDLHSGFPFFFYIPKRIRNFFLKGTSVDWMRTVDVPSLKKLLTIIDKTEPHARISIKKINYSSSNINPRLRLTYQIMKKMGLLQLMPMGYIIIVRRE